MLCFAIYSDFFYEVRIRPEPFSEEFRTDPLPRSEYLLSARTIGNRIRRRLPDLGISNYVAPTVMSIGRFEVFDDYEQIADKPQRLVLLVRRADGFETHRYSRNDRSWIIEPGIAKIHEDPESAVAEMVTWLTSEKQS